MKRSKRMAATLALAAGMTLLGGMTAQADTASVASNTQSSVSSDLPTTEGPFDTKEACEAHRADNPKPSQKCYHMTFSWYYSVSR